MLEQGNEIITDTIKLDHRKGKRFGKAGFITQLFTKEFYEEFRELNPEYSKKKDLELKQDYENIFDAMVSIVLTEPEGVMLPNNMGEMKLGLLRIHNVIDTVTSAEIGKPVKFSNHETNRKPGKLVWKTTYSRKVNSYLRYLGFRGTKHVRQRCFKAFKENGLQFKDVTNKRNFIK